MNHQEATRWREGDNLWLITPAELQTLHGDFPLESIGGTKKIQAELLDSRGDPTPEASDTRGGYTTWGIRSDTEPTIARRLEA